MAAKDKGLGFSHKVAYGAASLGEGMLITTLAFYLLFYYTDILKVNPAWAGFAVAVGRLWDAVTDPLMGQISDRTHTRWGRRRPYLLLGGVPLGLSFFLLWMTPESWPESGKLLYLAVMAIAFYTAHTVVVIPYMSLGAELSLDYDERTTIMGFRQFFFYVGWLPTAFMLVFLEQFDSVVTGYRAMGALWGVVLMLGFLITFAGTRERPEFQVRAGLPLVKALKETLINRTFLLLLIALFVAAWAFAFGGALWIYTVKYVLNREDSMHVYLMIIVIATLVFIPFYNWLSARIGKKATFALNMIAFGTAHGSGFIFFNHPWTWLVYLFCILQGLGAAGFLMLSLSIVADISDLDELTTGQRREGAYFGVMNLIQKLASSGGIVVVGFLLKWLAISPDVAPSPRGILGLKIAYTLFPLALLWITAVAFYLVFPLTRARAIEVRAQLDAKASVA